MKKIITWIKPTGSWMHIWNYFWAFKPIVDISKWNETYLFIADYHSLTSVHDAETLVKNKKRMLKEYKQYELDFIKSNSLQFDVKSSYF